jgi:hypothetical protein
VLICTCVGESTLVIWDPLGIPVPLTLQNLWRIAVDGTFVMMFDPDVILPEDVNADGPASAAKITWPFGSIALGASSAPNGEGIPFSKPLTSGPAAQVLVPGL